SQTALASFANGVELVGLSGMPTELRPGETMPVQLHWRVATNPRNDFAVSVKLVNLAGVALGGTDQIPYESSFPPRFWESGEFVDQNVAFSIPAVVPPGAYALRIGLEARRDGGVQPISLTGDSGTQPSYQTVRWRRLPPLTELSP